MKGPTIGETLRLSPDGKRVATSRVDPQIFNQDIWVIDLARDLPTRLTFDPSRDVNPIWSPDGSRVAYLAIKGATLNWSGLKVRGNKVMRLARR